MAKLEGWADEDLHPQIHEAVKVLHAAQEAYTLALANMERQYLKALDVAYQDQADAVRVLCVVPPPIGLEGASVRARNF